MRDVLTRGGGGGGVYGFGVRCSSCMHISPIDWSGKNGFGVTGSGCMHVSPMD